MRMASLPFHCSNCLATISEDVKKLWNRGGLNLESSNSVGWRQFWIRVWNLKIPNMIDNFIWRLSDGILPTKQALEKKHVIQDATCALCREGERKIASILYSDVA